MMLTGSLKSATESPRRFSSQTFVSFSKPSNSHLTGVKEQTNAWAPGFHIVSAQIYSTLPPDNICRTAVAPGLALTEHERSANLGRPESRRAETEKRG